MNIIKRKLLSWLTSYDDEPKSTIKVNNADLASQENLNLLVYNAIGGKVVEFRSYDRKTDHVSQQLYVIHENDDFAERLSKIIILESLK